MAQKVILEIDDEDTKATELLRRKLIYNFPIEYLRNDEIVLKQQPVLAQFKLQVIEKPENNEVINP